ncbi:MAG TPA: SH3 domain-containing protein [Terriglobales bacterium]|nr:SH3 domain-containing protein [Terriglobales bacterium]
MKAVCLVLLTCVLAFASPAHAQRAGVIDDPDGFVNVRAERSADAAVIATVKTGEPFSFESESDGDWCKVTLTSGESGWMQLSSIRLHFTGKDLPASEKDPAGESEIDQFAHGRGLDYAAVSRRAARGDAKALKQFFSLAQDADGAAAESIGGVPTVVYHLLGDEKFAKFLLAQPLPYRMMVRNRILSDGLMPPASLYLSRHFPLTAKALFQRETVDWFSPNGLYAIRKVFTDELELSGSKVERAELIEKKTGRVLLDLTPDDIGTGAQREGEAFWSPDSKRVACLSSDLTEQRGNLFSTPRPAPHRKQTAVYQLSDDSFIRVELPLSEVPGRESDTELERAILGHEYTEPIRWQKPNVLVLQRHEYYEKLRPTAIAT